MNIAVCIKQVPSTGAEIDMATGSIVRTRENAVINPYDRYALEAALRLKAEWAGSLCAFSMGPAGAESVLREASAMGADRCVLITDRAFAGADTYATAYTLFRAIRYAGRFDVVVCGRQTTDGDTSQVGPELAALMDIPFCCRVSELRAAGDSLRVKQQMSFSRQTVVMPLPCLVSVDKAEFLPRIPSARSRLAARHAEIERITLAELGADEAAAFGQAGSCTKVLRSYYVSLPKKCTPLPCDGKSAAPSILSLLGEPAEKGGGL